MSIALRSPYSSATTSVSNVVVVTGDLIVVFAITQGTGGGSATSCSDGINTYTKWSPSSYPASVWATVYYAIASSSTTLSSITVGLPGTYNSLNVHVYSGCLANVSTVLDISNSLVEGSSGTSHTGASITTTNANDVLFSGWYTYYSGGQITENAQSFVKEQEINSAGSYETTLDRIVSSTGSYYDATTTSTSNIFGNVILAFKAATVITYQPYWMII